MAPHSPDLSVVYANFAEQSVRAAFQTWEALFGQLRPLEADERAFLSQVENGAVLTARTLVEKSVEAATRPLELFPRP
ncbi:MAG: hypothetical protein KGJ23_13260 [Euryarchaeota archaeon]|nr:hypothetical protein [Euryarchaeota archaeon]MDE1837567.1 hypothetical protein [Euryarchaeota archaeon]MDE2046123.1 hypothetical protein [Thermoplasmata archaeon]